MGLWYSISKSGEVTNFRRRPSALTSIVDDAGCAIPTIATSRPMDGSSSPTPPRATTPMSGAGSIESRPTGRLLCYDPRTGKTTTILGKYRYANGVCIAHDGKSLFMANPGPAG